MSETNKNNLPDPLDQIIDDEQEEDATYSDRGSTMTEWMRKNNTTDPWEEAEQEEARSMYYE